MERKGSASSIMKADTLTVRERMKVELMRQREDMRKNRYDRENGTIYNNNICPVCHRRHFVGVICRKHRGSVCEKHCLECKYHEPQFWHCIYKETEPIDMRKWRLVYGCREKGALWQGVWRRILLDADQTHGEMVDALKRTSPKYIVKEKPDENGDYAIVDIETGEIQRFVAKFIQSCGMWACVEYIKS